MPSNVTPVCGLSDHIVDVRSHTGPGFGSQMVTDRSLRPSPLRGRAPDGQRTGMAKDVLHHDEKEGWGSGE